MKKLLMIAQIMFLAFAMQAQTSVGFNVGATSSKLSFDNGDNDVEGVDVKEKRALGITFGLALEQIISNSFSIAGEVNFQQKGYVLDSELNGIFVGSAKSKISFNSIEIPLLARYSFGETTKFYVNAGPYFNFNTGGVFKSEGSNNFSGEVMSYDNSGKIIFKEEPENYIGDDLYTGDEINRFIFGINFGGGVKIPVSKGSFVIDARFGFGLTDYNKIDEDELDGYEPLKSNTIALKVGYMITL